MHLQNGAVNGVRNLTLVTTKRRHWYDPGGILSVRLFGRPVIIVNSVAILDELDKKGALYSDRPVLEMAGELVGHSQSVILIGYGARFRTYRKYLSRYIGSHKAIQEHHPLIERECRRFLKRLITNPDDLMPHLRKYVLHIPSNSDFPKKTKKK